MALKSSLWHNRDFLLLWSGQTLSSVGTAVSLLAFPLLILAVTRSPAQAGFISAMRSLTYLLFVLPAGALVDRWDRKRVMVVCDAGRLLSMASIFFIGISGRLTIEVLYITGFLDALLGTFFSIAEVSCLPQIVDRAQLPSAMGRTQATTGIMNLVGSPLGGLLFSIQMFLPFLADAASYLASLVSLLFMRVQFQEQREAIDQHLFKDIAEGLHWLWKQPILRAMALVTSGNVFFGAGQTLIVIIIAQSHHASSEKIGIILSIGGIGGIIGSMVAAKVQQRVRFAVVILGVLWLDALLWIPLISLPSLLLLGCTVGTTYFLSPIYNIVNMGYRFKLTPDAMRGRVNSVSRLISNGLAPLGLTLTGLLLQYYGAQVTIMFAVGGQLLLAFCAMTSSSIRYAHVLDLSHRHSASPD
ncbi:MFS transporter [Tengunoibacter tsumagoiensis]|uniref:MFS transporter n=1 Tax=Tengunoibacter tsumagoiensis TaxID=2014871 RepID=A0A402A8Y7_9CHLR|nr:MFS transporter [Tengunoibacter tsumagoiensis]GCE15411.1 MFS transporter [Tengunoibacter tsumagoiensis]